jgi:hypothetical protein
MLRACQLSFAGAAAAEAALMEARRRVRFNEGRDR